MDFSVIAEIAKAAKTQEADSVTCYSVSFDARHISPYTHSTLAMYVGEHFLCCCYFLLNIRKRG